MKIILLIDSLGAGGAQRQISNLAIELNQKGHDVHVVRYYKDDFYLHLFEDSGIEIVDVFVKNPIQRIIKVRKTIRNICPEILISFLDTPNLLAALSSIGRHNWRLVISDRNSNEMCFLNFKTKIFRMIQAKYADAIVCNSKCSANLWKKYFPKVENKLHTIYNIIEVPNLQTKFRNDNKCRLVIAARYEKVKNLKGLLNAVSMLSNSERDMLELHWYGRAVVSEGENVFEEGVSFVQRQKLDMCVFLHPATDEIYPIMADADFVSLFSFREGLPNAIIEGMTLKKPIVTSKVSDYAVLVDEENGFLCDPNTPESIAMALRRAIDTTYEQRVEMGARSYEKIKKICSREVIVSQWEELIRKETT